MFEIQFLLGSLAGESASEIFDIKSFGQSLHRTRHLLYRDKKCGRNFLSDAAQLPVINGRKRSPIFHSRFPVLVIKKFFA